MADGGPRKEGGRNRRASTGIGRPGARRVRWREGRAELSDHRRGRAMAAAAAIVGVVLIALAAPRFLAGLHLSDSDAVMRRLDADRPVPLGDLVRAANDRAAAAEIHPAPTALADLAGLRLLQAGLADDARLRRALLDRTIDAAEAGLARAPAQPFLWANLAAARLAREGPTPEFDAALRLSIRMAPHEPLLLLRRIDLALDTWEALTPATQAAAALQIRRAARLMPDGLALLVRRHFSLAIVRPLLADDPASLALLDRSLSR